MPFTFSHPAIVLPLLSKGSKRFSATGLIVGSMAPDFESFITLSPYKPHGHMWIGMFWFDLPLALLITMLFHGIVRDPLIENLPRPLAERFHHFRNFPWFPYMRKHFGMIVISLFIGILSHLVWDAVTHLNFYYPDSIRSGVMFLGHRLYIELQWGCSLIGLIAVCWAIYKQPRTTVLQRNAMKYQYWLIMALLMILTATILVTVALSRIEIHPFLLIYVAISSFLAALTVVSLLYKLFVKKETDT